MEKEIINDARLPFAELEKYGLAENGYILMDADDVRAILEGRRTDFIRLYNVKEDGEIIKELDTKISCQTDDNGKLRLVFHPGYKEATYPEFLTDVEAEKLQNGETVNITKRITDDGKIKDIIVEFDAQTNEFVITDTKRIKAPDLMNSEYLSDAQKELFRAGKNVELSDGTKFRYTGVDKIGMYSNRVALIASIIIDGGISYLLYQGIKALTRNDIQGTMDQAYSKGYLQALDDYNLQNKNNVQEQDVHQNEEHGYKRSGVSR